MSLYIKETGKGNDEVLIFIHAENMAGWMWDKQVKAFPNFHCIVPDLPEHGESKDVTPFTVQGAADEIIEIIKEKDQGMANLVGISLGAQIILQILSKAPEIVDHAFISGALVNTTSPTENFEELLDYLMEVYIPVKNDRLIIGSYIRSYGIPKNQIKNFKESTIVIKPDSARKILKGNMLFKKPDHLENANVPVLVMAGEKDYNIIKKSARELASILPNSRTCLAPGVGHVWNLESPELFNEVLRSWITGISLPDNLIKI